MTSTIGCALQGSRRNREGKSMSHRPRPQSAAKPAKPKRHKSVPGEAGEPTQEDLDESLVETFPASDPPSWVPLARIGAPKKKESGI
ncbi:MAG: hypothetical protein WA418_33690 [Bradyrhizobium sp.]